MRKFLIASFLLLLLFPLARHGSAASVVGEITFIASNSELQSALDRRLELKGLAIPSDFYVVAESGEKEKIDELVKSLLDPGLRPVFIYGYKIDAAVLEKWFGDHGKVGCRPLVVAGVFPTLSLNGNLDGATVVMCGGDDSLRSEEWFRNWIADYWRETKEYLKEKGYATLQ